MDQTTESTLLRIHIGEADRLDGVPLYRAIVERMMAEGLAGVTVLRGIEGFGASARVHAAHVLQLSDDLPIIIECVDTTDRIDAVITVLDEMMDGGLITTERVAVRVRRGHR